MGKRERRSCHYCGVGMTKRGTKEPRSATVDHIIPKSRGGTSSPINIVMCCRRCNNEKGNFTGVEYRAWIEAGRPQREVHYADVSHRTKCTVRPSRVQITSQLLSRES